MLDGSKKLYNTMKDAILYLVQHDKPTTFMGLAVAAYIRYVTGMDEEGNDIDVAKVLDPLAKVSQPRPPRHTCLRVSSVRAYAHAPVAHMTLVPNHVRKAVALVHSLASCPFACPCSPSAASGAEGARPSCLRLHAPLHPREWPRHRGKRMLPRHTCSNNPSPDDDLFYE